MKICPNCKGSGDAFKYEHNGYKKYWYPCPVCNGGKQEPDLKRYEKLLTEPHRERK